MLLSPSHTISLCLIFSPSLGLCHLTKQVFPDIFRYFGGGGVLACMCTSCVPTKIRKQYQIPQNWSHWWCEPPCWCWGLNLGFQQLLLIPGPTLQLPGFLTGSPWTCKFLEEDSACLLTAVPLHTERCPARSIWELLVDWRNSFSEAITGTWHMMQTTASIPKRVWTGKTRSSLGNQYFSSEVRI